MSESDELLNRLSESERLFHGSPVGTKIVDAICLIRSQQQRINELTSERDRLKAELDLALAIIRRPVLLRCGWNEGQNMCGWWWDGQWMGGVLSEVISRIARGAAEAAKELMRQQYNEQTERLIAAESQRDGEEKT